MRARTPGRTHTPWTRTHRTRLGRSAVGRTMGQAGKPAILSVWNGKGNRGIQGAPEQAAGRLIERAIDEAFSALIS